MLLETYGKPWDFELLDTGNGYRLEKWGGVILTRPDPQIIWPRSLPESEWAKTWAIYKSSTFLRDIKPRRKNYFKTHSSSTKGLVLDSSSQQAPESILGKVLDKSPTDEGRGRWDIKKSIPDPWVINYQNTRFLLKLSPFKHTGLFPEQAAQWEWMLDKLKISAEGGSASGGKNKRSKILNLFAYTGGATMILAKAGCQVTHLDASKPSLNWANENYKLNFGHQYPPFDYAQGEHSPAGNVRWILDDAVKFVKREARRGVKYDGIIMDPPAFGHGPTGKQWKFNDDLPGLLADCVSLLSETSKFLVINGYATNSSALALNNLLEDAMKQRGGKIEFGELCLRQQFYPDRQNRVGAGRLISTGIFARWHK